MKIESIKLIMILVAVCAEVKGVPQQQGIKSEGEKQPKSINDNAFPLNVNKGLLALKKFREEIPELIRNISEQEGKAPSTNQGVTGLGLGTLFNTLLGGVNTVYQDLLNRQQAFINLLTCGNCVNEGWDAIMEVAMTIPELEWVYKPSDKLPATFFTAIHQNGSVTGIGGSVVNGKPIAEYAFGNEGIKQRL